jgi:hypothetical protein
MTATSASGTNQIHSSTFEFGKKELRIGVELRLEKQRVDVYSPVPGSTKWKSREGWFESDERSGGDAE